MAAVKNEHKSAPWIVTDFETGGIDLSKHGITEIAMMAINGATLEELGRYESLIQPYGFQYDPIAFEKTGLSEAKLIKDGKPFDVVFNEVDEWLKKMNIFNNTTMYKPILCAHNSPFEVQCFQHLYNVAKKPEGLGKVLQCSTDFHGNLIPAYLDTMQLSRMLFAANIRIKTVSLEVTCEQAGIPSADGHRAMNDVIPTAEFLKLAIKYLRSAESGSAVSVDKELSFRQGFQFEF